MFFKEFQECVCRQCSWCQDALIEAVERIAEGYLTIPLALTSPLWYEREGVNKYNTSKKFWMI